MAPGQQLYNIAHRGARSLAPENTMAAIEKAWEVGAHGIEIDVRATRDGALIVVHDQSLARTTDVGERYPGRLHDPVSSFLLAEVCSLDAGSWFIGRDPFGEIAAGRVSPDELVRIERQRIPTLAEVLSLVAARSWYVNVELKDPLPPAMLEKALALIEESGPVPGRVAVSSFNHHYLRRIRSLRPDLEVQALIGANGSRPQDWGTFEFTTYNANAALTDEQQIARAHSRGCRVNLYTVNDPEQMRRFLAAGVDKIITDYPQVLRGIDPDSRRSPDQSI